jgi:hypothetical protein
MLGFFCYDIHNNQQGRARGADTAISQIHDKHVTHNHQT